MIEKAVQLFFPSGKNAEGSLTDFDIDLTDFQQHSLEDSITIEELYEKTKFLFLHFYLTTKTRDIARDIYLKERNSKTTAQEGEGTHDRPDAFRRSPDTSTTDSVEINTSDVIYVRNSTVLANASSEIVSLVYTTLDPQSVHRGQILRRLIKVFSEESITEDDIYLKGILPDGKLERAQVRILE